MTQGTQPSKKHHAKQKSKAQGARPAAAGPALPRASWRATSPPEPFSVGTRVLGGPFPSLPRHSHSFFKKMYLCMKRRVTKREGEKDHQPTSLLLSELLTAGTGSVPRPAARNSTLISKWVTGAHRVGPSPATFQAH